ncbi:MAG: hypothetical protein AAF652_07570 [Cyanobacteria bacterium P01_C01_bin.72]
MKRLKAIALKLLRNEFVSMIAFPIVFYCQAIAPTDQKYYN